MSEQILIAIAFIAFLLIIVSIGISSSVFQKQTTTDYLLASRNVNPWLTALSAMSTGQSGLLFTGQVGFTYTVGLSSIWLVIGWAIGDYLAWWFVFKPLREVSEVTSAETVPAFLGQNTEGSKAIVRVAGLIVLIFLGSYAAAQLVAGSKALHVVFGWDYWIGNVAGAIVIGIYCFTGGIRASIWTDAMQSVVMIGSLLSLTVLAVSDCGGLTQLWEKLGDIDPKLVSLAPSNLPMGWLPFLAGWVGAGFGVVGQPHITIQAMAINSADKIGFARDVKTLAALTTSSCATVVGLAARVLMPDLLTSSDPELALISLSKEFFPFFAVGLMLAGLFAATISTADSQILSCSAALTQDMFPQGSKSYKWMKLGTLTMTTVILFIALSGNNNVFSLVTFSWSALAGTLGPLLIVQAWQQPIKVSVALAMMGVGLTTALVWNLVFKLSGIVYEVLPAMTAGILVYLIARFFESSKGLKN